MSRTILDITRRLETGMPVWPGDAEVEIVSRPMEGGGTVSHLATTCHAGTHLETGRHVRTGGADVGSLPLELLVGPAELVRVEVEAGGRVHRRHLPAGWRPADPRVLIATGTFPAGAEVAAGRFAGLAPELVRWLAEEGVRLVGVDTPSVDPLTDSALAAHHTLAECGMVWLEGLLLDAVPQGRYELVALPLPLAGSEAAPVRAALVREP